jgi:hypothetical protein
MFEMQSLMVVMAVGVALVGSYLWLKPKRRD